MEMNKMIEIENISIMEKYSNNFSWISLMAAHDFSSDFATNS